MAKNRRTPDLWCHYCGTPVTAETRTWDHIVPRALDGSNRSSNLITACSSCNTEKRDEFPTCRCMDCSLAVRIWQTLDASPQHVPLVKIFFEIPLNYRPSY